MAYDTVKLRSPYLDLSVIRRIEQQCILRLGQHCGTGEILYELHAGQLLGSWDSRISVMPKHEEHIADKNGRVRLQPCQPYLLIEASVHKVALGHNVYGGPTNFLQAARDLVALVEQMLETELPHADVWTVHRVDVANVFKLPSGSIKEFFDGLQLMGFPRRGAKAMKCAGSLYFPGKTTTVKFYHKGPEFKVHDYARLKGYFKTLFIHLNGPDEKNAARVERKVNALQRLAQQRLRVEVEIHSDKFQYDYGRNPQVGEVTDAYLEAIHDSEIERILREGKQGMDTVRTEQAVWRRLEGLYEPKRAHFLHAFWQTMATRGDEIARQRYSKTAFYRSRKLLEEAGVSWRGTDVFVVANDSPIHDFAPLRADRRFCSLPARNRPEYHVSRDLMRLAA